MADMHVYDGDGRKWTVIMHFAVPNVNNAVAVNYRTALVNSGLGGTTTMTEGTGAGEITAAEKADVEAGILYEHVASFLVESGGKQAAELRASLREFYAKEETRIIDVLKSKLRYFGHTESKA